MFCVGTNYFLVSLKIIIPHVRLKLLFFKMNVLMSTSTLHKVCYMLSGNAGSR